MTPFYLLSDGSLSADKAGSDAPASEMQVVADPDDPADTLTGSTSFAGARDARPFESSGEPQTCLSLCSRYCVETDESFVFRRGGLGADLHVG